MAKRPRDTNQLAKLIVDISTGETEKPASPYAPKRGRAGGLKGGVIRAKKLAPEKRVQIAKKAAKVRWGAKPRKVEAGGS